MGGILAIMDGKGYLFHELKYRKRQRKLKIRYLKQPFKVSKVLSFSFVKGVPFSMEGT